MLMQVIQFHHLSLHMFWHCAVMVMHVNLSKQQNSSTSSESVTSHTLKERCG